MTCTYYRCDWRHPPNDEPVQIFYEVNEDGDVPRIINVFAEGAARAETLADYVGREYELPGLNSFVEGHFLEAIKGMPLDVPDVPDADESGESVTLTIIDRAEFVANFLAHRKVRG